MAMSSDRSNPSSDPSYGWTELRRRALWVLVFRNGDLAKEVTVKADCFPNFGLEVVWRFGITIFSPKI